MVNKVAFFADALVTLLILLMAKEPATATFDEAPPATARLSISASSVASTKTSLALTVAVSMLASLVLSITL